MSEIFLPLVMNNFVVVEEDEPMKPIVDISYWQSPDLIDYNKFAASISGAILRGVYGIWKDKHFDRHYQELYSRGVPIGTYHYIIGNYSGKSQAEIMKGAIVGKDLKLGIWNDVEDRNATTGLSASIVIDYQNNIENMTEKKAGIYTGVYAWSEIMGNLAYMFADRALWIAHYGVIAPSLPRYGGWNKWLLWQMSSSGRIDGYSNNIDIDLFNGSEEEYRKYFNLDEIIPAPELPPTSGVILPELKVLRNMNIRSDPTISSYIVGTRAVGDIVKVKDIYATSSTSVWVKDERGWSAIVHGLLKYME